MQPTLLILAAGMASRYGSMKQMESFGPAGETIMDYSIYDAIRAGFKKVVFIIRKDFADNFKQAFEPRLKGKIEIDYVYQELNHALWYCSCSIVCRGCGERTICCDQCR
jgi:CTP:molybdopterin cytidylyltransferase MocA